MRVARRVLRQMMFPQVRLSLLDRSRTRAGEPDAAALRHTVERARRAEELGYHRFWVAEHHAVPGIASGSPPVLIAAVAARTERIRVGSGGVMLPNHQPFVVAEQFAMLEALYPGRIDLGVGRSLGFTPPVRRALRRDSAAPDTFAADLAELRAYLDGSAPVTVRPRPALPVPVFVLATSRGLAIAGDAGLPVVLGGPVLDDEGIGEGLADYRARVRAAGAEPYVVVSRDVLVADSVAAARALALPEAWALAAARTTGQFPALEPVDVGRPLSARQRSVVEEAVDRTVHGDEETVAEALAGLLARTGADELLVSTSTFDRSALRDSDARLARMFTAVRT
ncbi:MsnO8 family LLM class oxidoreductase [Pseudonocardia alaniniphila]|uniref:MsnO8 family LLM class oxidoreductase n=1 Tax=Pseudonocardia alaniniphila TaxID=75291 RepID=A0ABS9TT63_9PSEU|nr:MsnO8 family LLM class oxidoreductase [Pseudonocardia alaniniphila]MCH6171583.1 MsnO8 family LLM class oxidoreductase [Pseudonocardia alaniniphila]